MKKFLMPGLLLAAMSLHSCDDKGIDNGGPADEPLSAGSEILFGAVLDGGQAQSRTEYGDETDGVFPIYWKHATDDKELDRIYIHSPQAAAGNERAVYIVKPESEKFTGYSKVVTEGEDKGVVVGQSGAEHDFYGFYPVSQVLNEKFADDGKQKYLYGLMPSVQKVTFPADPDATTGMYVGEHNMDYCFMTAHTRVIPAAGKSVQLQFEPWSTVLDITLPGPNTTDAGASATITDIIVRSMPDASGNTPEIAGTFKYVFPDNVGGKGSLTLETVGNDATMEPDHILTVEVYNSEGTKGVVLKKDELLNLKAFLLPVENVAGIRVEVYGAGNKMWDIDLKKPDGRDLLTPGKIHKVGLPNIKLPGKDDYSSWMTEMSDEMPVTQLSIPGSYESFSYNETDESSKMQSLTISEQFEAGIRAFRANVAVKDGNDGKIGATVEGKHLHIVSPDGSKDIMPLGEAIHILHQEMQSRGNQELCVLLLNQSNISESPDLSNASTANRDYYKQLKAYAEYMQQHGITAADPGADLRLKNFRGKVILQGMLNSNVPNGNNGLCESWNGTKNATLTPMYNIQRWLRGGETISDAGGTVRSKPGDADVGIKSWQEADGAPMLLSWTTKVSESELRVSPLTYGRVGTFGDAVARYPSDIHYLSDQGVTWSAPTTTDVRPGLAYMAAQVVFKGTTMHTKDQENAETTLNYASKSNMYFDYTKLNGENKWGQTYEGWINSPNDPNYLWWVRNEATFNKNDASPVWKVVSAAWDNHVSSKIVKAYKETGGRILITTDICTACKNAPSGVVNWSSDYVAGVNYYFTINFMNKLMPNAKNHPNNNQGMLPTNGLNVKNYPETSLYQAFIDMPLGTIFMYQVPDRDADIEPKEDDKYYTTEEGYTKAHQWHVRQMIKLLVEHSMRFSNNYKGN